MKQVTLREYGAELIGELLEDLNRRARERGEDRELVLERPRPRLVGAEVVPLRAARLALRRGASTVGVE
jgi:hypothetical protein